MKRPFHCFCVKLSQSDLHCSCLQKLQQSSGGTGEKEGQEKSIVFAAACSTQRLKVTQTLLWGDTGVQQRGSKEQGAQQAQEEECKTHRATTVWKGNYQKRYGEYSINVLSHSVISSCPHFCICSLSKSLQRAASPCRHPHTPTKKFRSPGPCSGLTTGKSRPAWIPQ